MAGAGEGVVVSISGVGGAIVKFASLFGEAADCRLHLVILGYTWWNELACSWGVDKEMEGGAGQWLAVIGSSVDYQEEDSRLSCRNLLYSNVGSGFC